MPPVRQTGDLAFTPGRITETLTKGCDALVRLTPAVTVVPQRRGAPCA
jgi:hypothetical protein